MRELDDEQGTSLRQSMTAAFRSRRVVLLHVQEKISLSVFFDPFVSNSTRVSFFRYLVILSFLILHSLHHKE